MNRQTKLKLRSEKGSVKGEPQSAGFLHDSSFSNDERGSIDRSQSVQGEYLGSSGINMAPNGYLQGQAVAMPQIMGGQGVMLMPIQMEHLYCSREFPIFPRVVPFLQFKTIECTVKTYHDHKQCPLYHSSKDRRRCPQKQIYEPDLCPTVAAGKICSNYEKCKFSHNTVEQFYHPKKYKTKLCAGIAPGAPSTKCIYSTFCSFAHTEEELRIKKLHRMEKSSDFFRYFYKTVYCPFNHNHDKSVCEYAHNVQDYRRDPTSVAYNAETCKKWSGSSEISKYEDGGCNYNEACNKCHGWKELEYHPKFFKTRQCTHAEKCTRADCGYLHPNETPKPEMKHLSGKKLPESLKESFTSTRRPKGKVAASQSRESSSKDERLLTFNSSSRSVLGNNDSLQARKDENDRADLDSIVGMPHARGGQARTELGNHEDTYSENGRPPFTEDSLYGDQRNGRKFSVETVIGGTEERFCLRSEHARPDYSRMFISPLKLMNNYGPKSPLETRTLTASPSMSSLTLTSLTDDENIEGDLVLSIMRKYSLTENALMGGDMRQIEQLPKISEEDIQRLLTYRELLLDSKCEKDLSRILGDFPARNQCFKKS